MSEKEKRIRAITRLYYSNPKIQKIIFEFSKDREVIPRYFDGFGKRPDTIQYPSDVMGLVNKGATSFHASEEIWSDPLRIDSDMSSKELDSLRKSWDLIIDVDSPYLDYSKLATELIIDELENNGVKNYGIKFSGSKGFHVIVPAMAFPEIHDSQKTKEMFPEWPRAISEYLMFKIRQIYNKKITALNINFKALEERTKLSREDITEIPCPNCGEQSKKGNLVHFKCDICGNPYARPNFKVTKRKLKCVGETCPGYFEIISEEDYFFCENCKTRLEIDITKKFWQTSGFKSSKTTYSKNLSDKKTSTDFKEEISAAKLASLDLVLVASRHLFRMPYSLHEKTALASVVITKDQIKSFAPKDASPLTVQIKEFYLNPIPGEATTLLSNAIKWKGKQEIEQEKAQKNKYDSYAPTDFSGVTEDMFPKPIKKLMKGLNEGRKRGLFILLTFLRSLNFSPKYINEKIIDWNKKNDPPLKEGYVRSQVDWHMKQKKKILPPNYSNPSFYKDLNLLDSEPNAKNPISEIARTIRKRNKSF